MPFAVLSRDIYERTGKEPFAMFYDKFLSPNAVVSKRAMQILVAGQIALFVLGWQSLTPAVIPKPGDVLESLVGLYQSGVVAELMTSVTLFLESMFIATVFSLLLSYSAALAFFSPLANAWTKLRFMSVIGLPFVFTLFIGGGHALKLALMVFSVSVFMVTGMLDVLAAIPKEKYDLARTLRMGEWQVLWEVQILGRIDVMFDVIRQNGAMSWLLLPLVEGLVRSGGGIGVVLVTQNKQFHLADIFAIQLSILGLGVFQDFGIGWIKKTVCPYADLLLERR